MLKEMMPVIKSIERGLLHVPDQRLDPFHKRMLLSVKKVDMLRAI